MGPRQDLVLIDTNVFLIDLRYRRNNHFEINRTFLDHIAKTKIGFTTIVNLLELCGILSFNLNEKQLIELWFHFQSRYEVAVLPSTNLDDRFPGIEIMQIFEILKRKTSMGDALMISVAQKHLPFISTMVSWDDLHVKNIFPGNVFSPDEFMQSTNAGR